MSTISIQMADTYLARLDEKCKQLGFGSWEELLQSEPTDLNHATFNEFEDEIVYRIRKVSDEKIAEDNDLRMYPYVFVPYVLPIYLAHFGFKPKVTHEINLDDHPDVTIYTQQQGDQYIFGEFLCQDIVVLMHIEKQYGEGHGFGWCPDIVERRHNENKKAYKELKKIPSHDGHELFYINRLNFFDL
jgi:hypothetical protein